MDRIDQVSDLFHDTGSELQAQYDQYEEQLGDYAEAAADEIDQIAQRLKGRNKNPIMRAKRRLVRKRPGLALGLVLILGILIGRFMPKGKGSESHNASHTHQAAHTPPTGDSHA